MARRYVRRWLAACALAATFIGPTLAADHRVIEGRVVGVTDGGTITMLDRDKVQHKVRLAGIDAPEKKQPFGECSRQNLAALAF